MNKKAVFIGSGNMSSSIIRGIVKSGKIAPSNIYATDIDEIKLNELHVELDINVSTDNTSVLEGADYVFLCVKPDKIISVCGEIREYIGENTTVISIAAGIPVQTLTNALGPDKNIIRIMPNLPISVGEGMCMICENEKIDPAIMQEVEDILSSMG
ncbi:MAG: pyrroline-5-carboxylate reductase, partial [Anaerofustis stercorihominis]|nr:pyrroline-5-carboxylate reductase [Anaerofustis stercorihominis]